MGFYPADIRTKAPSALGNLSLELLHTMECRACPLNNQRGLKHPHMQPAGTKQPLIYILGEAPGEVEDKQGKPFVGPAGRVLRFRIPDKWDDKIRWNNCVRTRPPKNRDPSPIEIECCRPSVAGDIAATKPEAIFGFGNVPLHWALGETGITKWNGKRVPVTVMGHTCWFYPMLHPSFIMRGRKFAPSRTSDYGSDDELAFAHDIKRALAEIEDLPKPIVHTEQDALAGVDFVTGSRGEKDVERVLAFLDSLYTKKVVGFDYETNCLRPYTEGAKILTVALSSEDGTFAFPLDHSGSEWTAKQADRVEDALERFILKAPCRKIAHNLAFEMEWTAFFYGAESIRTGTWGDSQSQAYILDGRQGTNSLDFLCLQYFGLRVKTISTSYRSHDRKQLDKTPVDIVLRYNGMDAKYHRLVYLKQHARLMKEGLLSVYKAHLPRVPTTVLTQLEGVPVDPKVVTKFFIEHTKELKRLEAKIEALQVIKDYTQKTGKKFRPTANADAKNIVMALGITDDPKAKVDEATINQIDHPWARLLIKWRKVNKLRSTYVIPLMPAKEIEKRLEVKPAEATKASKIYPDGLLHPVISTTKTITWRTSSEEPNSQNFPKRKHREIRAEICPGGDYRVVSIDYAQIQARNVAMESKDKALVQAYWDRYDIHTTWMERIIQLYPRWIKEGVKALVKDKALAKYYRDVAKNGIVFPSFFGARPKKVSTVLNIPMPVAEQLHEEFWEQFPDIKNWHERLFKEYKQTGYVTGLSGFRRRAPISPTELINAPIQADEAIIVCDAMARLSDMGYQAAMEIHDDLTFIWHKKDIEKNLCEVIPAMVNVPFKWAHIVPIGVEVAVGTDWSNTQGIGEYYSDLWNGDLGLKTEDPNSGDWSDGTGWLAVAKANKGRPVERMLKK